ncbi:MAG: hypothetical protein QM533_12560 [Cytophagales bacterium]|nr:hypothetical protein [Cytophagales bacterium]
MIKIIIGFLIIAGAAFYLLTKPGASIDMGGEKHGVEEAHPAPTAAPAAPASAAKP